MRRKQRVQERFGTMKGSLAQPCEGVGQGNHIPFCGAHQNVKRPGYFKPFLPGDSRPSLFINENQVSLELKAQSERGLFPFVERHQRQIVNSLLRRNNPQPCRRRFDLAAHIRRSCRLLEFPIDDDRDVDGFKQLWQKIEVIDFGQIADKCGIGDNDPQSNTKPLQGLNLPVDLFQRVSVVRDAMGLEKSVQFNPG